MSEETMVAALKRFGWEGGPEFFRRYNSDPWVFNLANAVERLTAENERLRQAAMPQPQRATDPGWFVQPGDPRVNL